MDTILQNDFFLHDFFTREYWKQHFSTVLQIVIILAITYIVNRVVGFLFRRFIRRASYSNTGVTKLQFFRHFITAAIYIMGGAIAMHTIPALRALSVSIFAGAGILAAIAGFASQQAFSNVVSGMFIVLFQPYRVNDRIRVGSLFEGIVEDITLRHTVIRNMRNERVVIPNSVISNETIINSSIRDMRVCEFIEIGISYDSDIDLAMKIMQEEAMKHPFSMDVRSAADIEKGIPVVDVRLIGFGDSSVNLRAYVWAENWLNGFYMRTDLFKSIKERFDREGVEIPFPYRTLVFKNNPSQ
ncbi:MAG: mechanosensitive ion channel protein MscS [Chitinophagales bacterium]|nr:MAG: mechanosensitive ion channel protein MscS [Chitinophagales bacterium]